MVRLYTKTTNYELSKLSNAVDECRIIRIIMCLF